MGEHRFALWLLLVIFMLSGCASSANPQPRSDPPVGKAVPFSEEHLLGELHKGIFSDEKTLFVIYSGVEYTEVEHAIDTFLLDDYLCNNLLEKISLDSRVDETYLCLDLQLIFQKDVRAPIARVSNEAEILRVLIENWTLYMDKVTLVLEDCSFSEDEFFAMLDTAEINSALIPCEAKRVHYQEYPPEGNRQIVRMWLGLPVETDELADKQRELVQSVDAAADTIRTQAEEQGRDRRRLYREAYKFLLDSAEYDTQIALLTEAGRLGDEMYIDRSAYGAMVSGQTICNGYSRAYMALCHALELPCWVVAGTKDGVAHSWNVVRLGGEYYYVDCTSGSQGEDIRDSFFLELERMDELGYQQYEYVIVPDLDAFILRDIDSVQ